MKNIRLLAAFFVILVACSTKESTNEKEEIIESQRIEEAYFQELIDSAKVKGSILIFHENDFYSNDFEWAERGHLPASTFKIPNSIISLELGIMDSDSSMFTWKGEKRYMKEWEKDMNFKEAYDLSCVPCYQELARKTGVNRMSSMLEILRFGEMKVDSSTLDNFWLQGDSRISQFEQIDFLQRVKDEKIELKERTYEIMKRMMILESTESYTLRGKTGWSYQNNVDNLWFVGYLEGKNGIYYFATNIEATAESDMKAMLNTRKEISKKALKSIGAF